MLSLKRQYPRYLDRWLWWPMLLTLCRSPAAAQDQHVLSVFINAQNEHQVCLITNDDIPPTLTCDTAMTSSGPVAKGETVELRVTNRRFLSDYFFRVEPVRGPALPRVDRIKVVPLFVQKSTGAAEPVLPLIKPKTAMDYVIELLDPSATPAESLDRQQILEREAKRIQEDIKIFREEFDAAIGKGGIPVDCLNVTSYRTAYGLAACLNWELEQTQKGPWAAPPFRDEGAFRELDDRVETLLANMAAVNARLQISALVERGRQIQLEGDQYDKTALVIDANRDALTEAEALLDAAVGTDPLLGMKIRAELKKRTLDAYKADPGGKSVLTEAEANVVTEELLNRWKDQNSAARKQASALKATVSRPDESTLRTDADTIHRQIEFELPRLAVFMNDKQSNIISRLNYIYEHSEVKTPLVRRIDLDVLPKKDSVAFVVTRIDGFRGFSSTEETEGTVSGPQASPGMDQISRLEIPVARGVFTIDNGCHGLKEVFGICQGLGP
jgi:hypothetical protein